MTPGAELITVERRLETFNLTFMNAAPTEPLSGSQIDELRRAFDARW